MPTIEKSVVLSMLFKVNEKIPKEGLNNPKQLPLGSKNLGLGMMIYCKPLRTTWTFRTMYFLSKLKCVCLFFKERTVMSYRRQHPVDTKRSFLTEIHSSFSHGAAPNRSQEGYSACWGCNSALSGLELAGPRWSHSCQPQMPRNPWIMDPRGHNRKHGAKQDFTV